MDEVRETEDWFVRSFVAGALNVRRYRSWYAAGLVLAVALAVASPGQRVVPAVDGRPSSPNVAAAPAVTDKVVDPQISFTAAQVADALDPAGPATEDVALEPGDAAAPDFEFDPKVSPPTNPALAVAGPTAGKVCDTFGLAMFLAGVASPAVPVPVPSEVFGAVTPIYLACAEIPRPSPRMACEADDSVPAVPGAPVPVNPGAAAMIVEQANAVEAETGAQAGVSAGLAAAMGCRATT